MSRYSHITFVQAAAVNLSRARNCRTFFIYAFLDVLVIAAGEEEAAFLAFFSLNIFVVAFAYFDVSDVSLRGDAGAARRALYHSSAPEYLSDAIRFCCEKNVL